MNVDPATIVKLQNLRDYLYCLESPPDMNDPRGQILLELIDIVIADQAYHIGQLEAELNRFRPQPGSFSADEARALESGELTVWIRDGVS